MIGAYLTMPRKAELRDKPRPSLSRYHAYAQREALAAGLPLADVMGRSRSRASVVARWRVWRTLRNEGASYPGIAACSGFDHSSILYGVRRLAVVEAIPPMPVELRRIRYVGYEERA